jgi:triosephosphate isomerase
MPTPKNSLILANWKMQLNNTESLGLFKELKEKIKELKNTESVEVVVCPSFTALPDIAKIATDTKLKLGAQDVFWEQVGAYTGEISPEMLKECGCTYVIIGHSDRRTYLKETDEMVHLKIRAALNSLLYPIICVGETFKERQLGRKDYVVIRQVTQALSGIDLILDSTQLVIAYEPVWVIGSGQAIDSEEAEYMHQVIKQALFDLYPVKIVENCFRIIYGGSINSQIVKSFMVQPHIDGVLVGGASLNKEEFIGIIKEAIKVNVFK